MLQPSVHFGTPRAWRSGYYEDAALRLKFGSCEDDGPSQCFESRCRVVGERGEHSRLDCERHQQKRCFAAEIWDYKGLAINTLGYGDAALRLRNGAGETMWLPSCVGNQ
jgi:hypothetical protein